MTRIGVVAALPAEAAVLEPASGLAIRVSGIGAARARAAAMELIAEGAEGLVSWGCAGGLAAGLASGQILVPEQILDSDGTRLTADARWRGRVVALLRARLEPAGGAIAHADAVLATPLEKAALYRASGCIAVDMESAAVAAAAREARIPVLVVRAIADPAHSAIPRAALAGTGPRGEPRTGRLLAALAARPADLIALIRLRREFRAACAALARAAAAAGPTLGWS